MKHLLLLLLLLSGSCKFTQSLVDFPTGIEGFWFEAQVLATVQVGEAAYDVGIDMFDFVSEDGMFFCGDVWTNGCFAPSNRTITWNVGTPHVIVVEGHHAILWFLGYRDWRCAAHFDCSG